LDEADGLLEVGAAALLGADLHDAAVALGGRDHGRPSTMLCEMGFSQ